MENLKRFLAVGASAALLVTCMTGCGSTATTAEEAEEAAVSEEIGDVCETVFGQPADTVVATVNGEDLTLLDLGYWLAYNANQLGYYYFGSMDAITWDESIGDESGTTYADYVKDYALQTAEYYLIIEQQAKEAGIELTDEENAEVDAAMDDYITNFGESLWETAVSDGTVVEDDYDDEAKAEWIAENGAVDFQKEAAVYCTTTDYLREMTEINTLYADLEDYYYGEGGQEEVTDETIEQYITDTPYYGASSILFMNTEDADGNTIAFSDMDDDQKAALKEEAQAALDDILNADDPAAKFQEYQADNNDDTGSNYAGAGYVFTSGEMVEEYEDAVANATEGEILPELVESADYGYFIVMRNAVTGDSIPTDYASNGTTIRELYLSDAFNAKMSGWLDDAEIETTDAYDAIDMAAFATNLVALQDELYPTEETAEETEAATTETAAAETEAATTETASN